MESGSSQATEGDLVKYLKVRDVKKNIKSFQNLKNIIISREHFFRALSESPCHGGSRND